MAKLRILFLSFFLLQLFIPSQAAIADTGPKPTMEFTFSGEPVTIVSGIMYECDQADCTDAAPLEELGPQRFYCEAQSCRAMAYGFAPYHKLEIEFSDGLTRESNVFETAGFDSVYAVTVRPDDLLVESRFNPGNLLPGTVALLLLCACCLVTLVVVIALIIIFVQRRAES